MNKFWLASYPRSGNTFFRNVMYFAGGLTSSYYEIQEDGTLLYPDCFNDDMIKTHRLPLEIKEEHRNLPAVYLIRDGRDAVVSLARYLEQVTNIGSHYMSNLQEVIIAAEGSYNGGWGRHSHEWIKRADVVIRFEDLIADPAREAERCREVLALPSLNTASIPDFSSLKAGKGQYTGDILQSDSPEWTSLSQKFFRKGKVGNWKEEMPEEMQALYWSLHGEMMEKFGYGEDGSMVSADEFQNLVRQFQEEKISITESEEIRVLIEAKKLEDPYNDGIKRYVRGLVRGIEMLPEESKRGFNIDVYANGVVEHLYPSAPVSNEGQPNVEADHVNHYKSLVERTKLGIKWLLPEPIYKAGRFVYVNLNFRKMISYLDIPVAALFFWYTQRKIKKLTENYDLIHITLPQNIRPFKLAETPFIVTIHDVTHKLFPEYHTRENTRNAERGFRMASQLNTHYLSVSHNTEKDVMAHYDIDPSRMTTIYEAVDHEKFRIEYNPDEIARVREKYHIGSKPYLLCLYTLEPRKNLEKTLEAFRIFKQNHPDSDIQMVIAGNIGWKVKLQNKGNENIVYAGYIEDVDLSMLYTGALAFCYTSFYEGFGFPPLESMHCHTPVIYGDNSSMREIIGDAGLPADAHDVLDIADKMEMMVFDEELRNSLAKKGYLHSLGFRWDLIAKETLEMYQSVISKKNHTLNIKS